MLVFRTGRPIWLIQDGIVDINSKAAASGRKHDAVNQLERRKGFIGWNYSVTLKAPMVGAGHGPQLEAGWAFRGPMSKGGDAVVRSVRKQGGRIENATNERAVWRELFRNPTAVLVCMARLAWCAKYRQDVTRASWETSAKQAYDAPIGRPHFGADFCSLGATKKKGTYFPCLTSCRASPNLAPL
jgi:hypothetical protein